MQSPTKQYFMFTAQFLADVKKSETQLKSTVDQDSFHTSLQYQSIKTC